MPLSKLPVVSLEDANHRRRHREVTNSILDHSFDDSRVQTAGEKLAGVTVINAAYPPGDVRRYGVKGDGTDEHVAIQNAINAMAPTGGDVFFPGGTYDIGTTSLQGKDSVMIVGDAAELTILTYAGGTFPIDFAGGNNGCVDLYIKTNNKLSGGVQFGNDCRRAVLRRVTIQDVSLPAADRTGSGLSLFTTSAATTFSGNMMMEQVYLLGYKYGINIDCFEIPLKTWTTIVGSQVFIVGAGVVAGVATTAGSRCIIMSANTNGVGSAIFGGTLEGCEIPIQVANGGFGISYYGDIEGNVTDLPNIGASFCGEIVCHPAGTTHRAGANGTTNRWFYERLLNGEWDREAYFNHSFTLYEDSGSAAYHDVYRGASRIAGGSPTLKWRHATGNSGADAAPERNYLQTPSGNRITWGSAAPASGSWSLGDLAIYNGGAAGTKAGWRCTSSGSPGTWTPFAHSVIEASGTYDPPNLADGAGVTTTIAATSALGDFAIASFSLDLQSITLTAWVSAANTVSVRFQNESGGAIDLASGTLLVRVTKPG